MRNASSRRRKTVAQWALKVVSSATRMDTRKGVGNMEDASIEVVAQGHLKGSNHPQTLDEPTDRGATIAHLSHAIAYGTQGDTIPLRRQHLDNPSIGLVRWQSLLQERRFGRVQVVR